MKKIYGVKRTPFSEPPFLFFESKEDAISVAAELSLSDGCRLVCDCLFFEASQNQSPKVES